MILILSATGNFAMKKILIYIITLTAYISGYAQEPNELLATMTLRDKIAQLCVVATVFSEERDPQILQEWFKIQPIYHLEHAYIEKLIKEHHIGGIIFYGKNALPQEALHIIQHFQSLSKIPLLMTLDAEQGLGSRLDNQHVTRYPDNQTLGASNDLTLIYKTANEVGHQLKQLGIHVNFAPVVDINSNPNNPVIGKRSFGANKENVAACGIAYMQGLQDAGIIACAKHFPGHGDTSVDSHLALPLITHSLEHLKANELYPFQKLIDAGVKSIMTAHLEIPSLEPTPKLPASLSKSIITTLLQKEMGFHGLIFTDALGMKGVADNFQPGVIELKALQAGNDILLCPMDPIAAIDRIEKAVSLGEISESEINQKVLKLLKLKSP